MAGEPRHPINHWWPIGNKPSRTVADPVFWRPPETRRKWAKTVHNVCGLACVLGLTLNKPQQSWWSSLPQANSGPGCHGTKHLMSCCPPAGAGMSRVQFLIFHWHSASKFALGFAGQQVNVSSFSSYSILDHVASALVFHVCFRPATPQVRVINFDHWIFQSFSVTRTRQAAAAGPARVKIFKCVQSSWNSKSFPTFHFFCEFFNHDSCFFQVCPTCGTANRNFEICFLYFPATTRFVFFRVSL